MIYLLDTHLLLWALSAPDRLSADALAVIGDPSAGLMFSTAAPWEVAIKSKLGRRDFHADVRQFRRGLLHSGYAELSIDSSHVAGLVDLPELHKDPFDRIQIAQARVEGMILLTSDRTLARYGDPVQPV